MSGEREFGRVLPFVLVSVVIAASPLDAGSQLDVSFGIGGKVVTDASGRYDEARAVAIEPDGQIVVAGVAGTGFGQDFLLARYNVDGSLDRSFGTGGTVITDVSGRSDVAWALAIQPDGKIIAAGVADEDFALVRYNAEGTLDTRFGANGTLTTDFGGNDVAYALAVQADGDIVAAGVAAGRDFALARYLPNGTLNHSFGVGGKVVTDVAGSIDSSYAVAIEPDGQIVSAGATGRFPTAELALVRYNADGSLDAKFGTGGRVAIGFGKDARAHAVAIQPDGKIAAGGFVENGSSRDAGLARLNADGTVDGSFGAAGRLLTDFGGRNFASAMAFHPNGKIVVAGADDFPPYYDFAIAQYLGDGTADASFGADGTILTEFGGNSWINAVAVQSDGKIVAAGYARVASGADFALVRYTTGR